MNDAHGFAGNFHGKRQLGRFVIHQHHIGRFNGSVTAHTAHGDTDIGTGQNRRVIDAVTDIADQGFRLLFLVFVNHFFGKRDFVGRQKLTVNFVDTEGISDGFTDIFLVAG